MSRYSYPPLSIEAGGIRLLRLLPNKHARSSVQCELFEYCLQESDKATHLYEALSYVWGSSGTPQCILVDGRHFVVTANLHAALLHLRDQNIVRIIWIDAICINQEDEQEKSHQIQYMAKIYARASRVIVWLGETEDNCDRALEVIHSAAKSGYRSKFHKYRRAVKSLLQRQCFRRIWVLQEVAAARNIIIVCGSTEIHGYIFSLGLEQLKKGGLYIPVHSVTHLIGEAIFRPKYVSSISGREFLNICSLGELIDMYHTHDATKRHDKVYALLGMSSDDLSAGDLLPNYGLPWKELFRRLIIFLLGEGVSVKIWDNGQVAEIFSSGYVVGYVTRISEDDRVWMRYTPNHGHRQWEDFLDVQTSLDQVKEGDIICVLQEASSPIIIRPYEDYFVIIRVSVPLKHKRRSTFRHNFPLLWDWEQSRGEQRYREILKTLQETQENQSMKAIRLWNAAFIRKDVDQYRRAEVLIEEALRDYETFTGLEKIQIREEAVVEIAEHFGKKVMALLLDKKGNEIQITENVIVAAARNITDGKRVMALLLDKKGNEIQITEDVMVAALGNTRNGQEVMRLLLDRKGNEIQITEKAVAAAAGNIRDGEEVMRLLPDRKRTRSISQKTRW